ncbi:MAG: CDP-alcohol phosphatidyltransferase family protein [Alphaproteobacteria bacterium]|nr:CDP-alcohol phosphatidyltransferase family protein [Alphaproteobacteria bacterium]
MKLFVNFLSAFRIFTAFAIIPTLIYQLFWLTFILFILGAISDWFDGYLARKYNVCTKLGGVMDHIGDKLLVLNAMIMLSIMMPVWFIITPIIIMISRELYISGLREFLGTQKIEMPVPKARFSMGKIKTTLQMLSVAAFFLLFAIGTGINQETANNGFTMFWLRILPSIGIWGIWLALVASIWSATQYTKTFIGHLKKLN